MALMTRLTYTVQFLTPAFLGDAEQCGWRRYDLVPTPMWCP
ncbi:hypothetical protein [Candidatus Nitrospira inopinata]|nr:hypothetical protein [Candidatus Nitrospira inopinata]